MISILLTTSIVLFLLSLPLSAYAAGRTLRRLSFFFLLLGMAPFLFLAILGSLQSCDNAKTTISAVFTLCLVSAIAYVLLTIRRRLRSGGRTAKRSTTGKRLAGSTSRRGPDRDPWSGLL